MAGLMVSVGMFAATKASYPGGEPAMTKFITTNMQYPAASKANGVEGIVTVVVTINADGSVGPMKIQRVIDPDLEKEAMRIIKKMPKWTPATDDSGAAVASKVTIPVTFRLSE